MRRQYQEIYDCNKNKGLLPVSRNIHPELLHKSHKKKVEKKRMAAGYRRCTVRRVEST
jgi:hypothetical protein